MLLQMNHTIDEKLQENHNIIKYLYLRLTLSLSFNARKICVDTNILVCTH